MTHLSLVHRLRSRLHNLRVLARDAGSVSLEQIAITAGLVVIGLGTVAGIGAAVAHYMGKL